MCAWKKREILTLRNFYEKNWRKSEINVPFFSWLNRSSRPSTAHCRSFVITHSQTHHTPLYVWSVRHSDLYLSTLNTHKRQTSMLPAGIEPAIAANKRPQTHTLDRAATWIGNPKCRWKNNIKLDSKERGFENEGWIHESPDLEYRQEDVNMVMTFEPHIMLEMDLIPKKLLASNNYEGITLLYGIVMSKCTCIFRNDQVNGSNPWNK